MAEIEHRGTCEAPRWAGLSTFVRDMAWEMALILDIQVERGWITEHVRYAVCGEQSKVELFETMLADAIRRYNKEDDE